MTRFFEAELETSDLSAVPNSAFDLIMMAHVIEHLHNGEEVIAKLAHKLRPGGVLYIESPSERSLRLPSGVGCLNFRDDPTHVRLYTYREIAAACRQSGLQIAGHGTRRSPVWMLVDVLSFPLQVVSLLRHGKLFGPLIWDLVGFASFIIAKRPSGQAETT